LTDAWRLPYKQFANGDQHCLETVGLEKLDYNLTTLKDIPLNLKLVILLKFLNKQSLKL
jgi:hypothetical protein